MLKIALVINPLAGIGGSVALKGSDGADTVEKALALGATPQANERAKTCLAQLQAHKDRIQWVCAPNEMGEYALTDTGFLPEVIAMDLPDSRTSATDTDLAIKLLLAQAPDLLLFAGGDGTARDLYTAIQTYHHQDKPPVVLGIPAGVKIHSGVYSVSPSASAEVIKLILSNQLVNLREAQVRDIDESAFREGQVKTKLFGELFVPEAGHFLQATKVGGREDEALVKDDIGAYVAESLLEEDTLYFIGSGATTQSITTHLGLDGTLLGVDAIFNGQCIQQDLTANEIQLLVNHPDYAHCNKKIIVGVIGGQGHLFGRGNQQFTPDILKQIGKSNILVVATKTKITGLAQRPFLLDTSDIETDKALSGLYSVVAGYQDEVVYQASYL